MGKLKQTKKTLQMKFSLIALVGATAAIKIRSSKSDGPSSGGPPSCEDIGEHILKKCDSSENRKISWKEAVVCGAPKDFKGEFLKVAGKDAEVDMGEFVKVCEAHREDGSSLAQRGGSDESSSAGPPSCEDGSGEEKSLAQMCDCEDESGGMEKSLAQMRHPTCEDIGERSLAQEGEPSCEQIGEAILNNCDSSKNEKISWKEAKKCGAPKAMKKKFLAVAGEDKEIEMKEWIPACEDHRN